MLALRYGGEEEHAIAGLLHDVLEDGGEEWAVRIEPFGERVMRIVRDCTDGVPDARDPHGKRYGDPRFRELISPPAETAQSMIDRVHNALRNYIAEADQFDDITLLFVRRNQE